MSTTRTRPKLINVKLIPWDEAKGIYGIACEYDDGVVVREPWGLKPETQYAVSLRRREIFTPENLKGRHLNGRN